jgi:prepilin-type N-terminal cleavage/methylation domain-containing protein
MTVSHQTEPRGRQSGFSLVELMVALLIGLFLMLGAITVYNQSRATYRASEGVARLQEVARLALDVLEADIRMANFWGLNSKADYVTNRAGPGPLPSTFTAAQGARISSCGGAGSNWAINLDSYLDGSNNLYGLSCAPPAGHTAALASDVLVVRRANEVRATSLDTNRIHLQTSRIQGELFVPTCSTASDPTCIPSGYLPPVSQSSQLEVHAYYVSQQSTLRNDVPSLRRKVIGNVNSDADFIGDEEIVAGVEHMQVLLGIDTNGDTNIDLYVNPGAVPAAARVVSATIWLRIRSEEPDFGHRDDNAYQYGDMAAAVKPNDNYRRIVVTRTIQLRNTRV